MSYASGGLISASDFNGIANGTSGANIAWVWGTGYGSTGYGQSTTALASLTGGSTTTVTALQWSNMLAVLNNCQGHQTGTTYQLGPLNYSAGQTITAFANVTAAATGINQSANIAAYTAQGSTTTGTIFTTSVVTTTGWSFNVDRIVTFASAQAARYFFNAGGQLNFKCSVTGGTGSAANNSFTNIVNALGGFGLKNTSNTGRTGTGLNLTQNDTTLGYRTLAVNPSVPAFITVYDNTTAYTANYGVFAACTDVSDTTNGANGGTIRLRILLSGADHTWDDSVSCTLNTSVDIVYPETTYLSGTAWGTPTVS
jgi:hypothetical protein